MATARGCLLLSDRSCFNSAFKARLMRGPFEHLFRHFLQTRMGAGRRERAILTLDIFRI